jgi:hypothetical protein
VRRGSRMLVASVAAETGLSHGPACTAAERGGESAGVLSAGTVLHSRPILPRPCLP